MARDMEGEEGYLGEGTINFHPSAGTELGVASSYRDKMDGVEYDLRGQDAGLQTPTSTHDVTLMMSSRDVFWHNVKRPASSDAEGLAWAL